MKFTITQCSGFFDIKLSGMSDVSVYQACLNELFTHCNWKPGTSILLDEIDLDTSLLSNSDGRSIVGMFTGVRAKLGSSKVATVVARNLEFGMHRMFLSFVEDELDISGNLFRSRDEAIAWLTSA